MQIDRVHACQEPNRLLRMHIAENMKKSILCHSISFMSFCDCFCVFFSGFEEITFFVVL